MVFRRGVCVQRTLEFATAGGYASGLGNNASAALAQLVEHRIRNAGVVGSNPIGGTTTSSSKFECFLAKGRKLSVRVLPSLCKIQSQPAGDKLKLFGYVVGTPHLFNFPKHAIRLQFESTEDQGRQLCLSRVIAFVTVGRLSQF